MAVIVERRIAECDGFRVESPSGLIGWVEEAWRSSSGAVNALAVRLIDGRRGLLLAEQVTSILADSEEVFISAHASVLELAPPQLEAVSDDHGTPRLSAVWHTTGASFEPPAPPGIVRERLLALRPWRLAPPVAPAGERAFWKVLALLFVGIAVLVAAEIGVAFLAAYLANGHAV